MKAFITVMCIIMLSIAGGCGNAHTQIDKRIENARNLATDGDYNLARQECDQIIDHDSARMSARQTAELSLVYMRLYEASEDMDNAALAITCYGKALEKDSAEALSYYAMPGEENLQYVRQLVDIAMTLSGVSDGENDAMPADTTANGHE